MNYKYIISPSAGRWQATGNGVAGSLTIEIETDSVSPESSWLWDWMNAQADAQWDVADSRGWLKRISKLDAAE